jgi:RNA polymerase sigma factor (sigma-70 family)
MDDRVLVEGLIAGEHAAWREFEERCRARLRRVLARNGVTTQDLDDCYGELLVHLIDRDGHTLRQWRGEARFTTWLFVVAGRRAIDWVRRTQQLRGRLVEPWLDETVDGAIEPAVATDPADPEREVAARERIDAIRAAIEQLPAQERKVMRLRFVDDLSVDEIAVQLALTPNNVHQICHRAKAKLRETLTVAHADRDGGAVT